MSLHIRDYNSFRLFKTGKNIRETFRLRIEKQGVTAGHAMILHVLSDFECLSQVQMAKKLGITPASISTLIQSMKKEDLINRVPDPKDERIMLTTLTEKGKTQAVIVTNAWEEVEAVFKQHYSDEEYLLLKTLLDKANTPLEDEEVHHES